MLFPIGYVPYSIRIIERERKIANFKVSIFLSFVLFVKGGQNYMLEKDYQKGLIKRLEAAFPGCKVIKNDAQLKQGIPDLLILFKDKWACLEVKRSEHDRNKPRPNQEYWVEHYNNMSYASFIYPEIEEKIFSELREVFEV